MGSSRTGAADRISEGAGVVLILGDGVTDEQASSLLGTPVKLTYAEEAISLTDAAGATDPLLTEIIWNGAPQVRERWQVEGLDPSARSLVISFEDGEGILFEITGARLSYLHRTFRRGESPAPGLGILQLPYLSPRRTNRGNDPVVFCGLSRFASASQP